MRWRRHPDGVSLSGWYDGEVVDPRIAAHIDGCERCWTSVRSFAVVDETVRWGVPVLRDDRPPRRRAPARFAVGAMALVAAVALVTVAPSVGPGEGRSASRGRTAAAPITEPQPTGPGASLSPRQAAPASGEPVTGTDPGVAPVAAATGADPLILGVPVPDGDPAASAIAAEVLGAARAAAGDGAEIMAVTAGAPAPGGVDALVGGWGAGQWDSPNVVQVAGSDGVVIAGDPEAEQAGRLLASFATAEEEVIGVIRSVGPDAAFGDGLAAVRRTVDSELESGSSCAREVREVVARGAVVIAFAAQPPEVRVCMAALDASGIRPPGGVLVPPSMALDPEPPDVGGVDVVGLVGLPLAESEAPGAVRFRAATGARSYRALLTFAAVELAVALAAEGTSFRGAWQPEETWRSDLLQIERGRNVGIHAVRATPDGWRDHWGPDRFFEDHRDE